MSQGWIVEQTVPICSLETTQIVGVGQLGIPLLWKKVSFQKLIGLLQDIGEQVFSGLDQIQATGNGLVVGNS